MGVSDKTDFRPTFVRHGSMYSTRQRLDGEVEVLVGPVWRPGIEEIVDPWPRRT